MEFSKNQVYPALIQDLTQEGMGVAKVEGFTVFVPNTAIGDRGEIKLVKVLKHYGYGILTRLDSPSPDRVEPDCPVSGKCGGCLLRHISYQSELRWKQGMVADCFARIGEIDLPVSPILGSEVREGYRNKAQYPIQTGKDGKLKAGFYATHSHRLVEQTRCKLQPPVFGEILEWVLAFGDAHGWTGYDEATGKGLLRHLYLRMGFATGEIMVCPVVAGKGHLPQEQEFAHSLAEAFPGVASIVLNHNPQNTNVILGRENWLLWGKDTIDDILCGVRVTLSPHSFYQVNRDQAQRLYETALGLAQLKDSDVLLDLYCGAGTIGLAAAGLVKQVYGAEIVPQAVENARRNAAQNQIRNAEFLCADCSQAVEEFARRGIQPDVIVVDPPRKGCASEVLEAIRQFGPDRLVMISCNPATAARDCKALAEMGFEVEKIVPVDLFPRTGHVETVVLLSKLNAKQHIEVELNLDELDLTAAESKATYDEIKAYVLEKHGLKVSSLYISQVKRKCGLDVEQNYNLSKKEDTKVPQCPPEKEAAIMDALKHFQMI